MKLLHIDASILGDHSVSRAVSAAIVARLSGAIPGLELTYRDLAAAPLSHLSGAHLAGAQPGASHADGLQAELDAGAAALDAFLAADIVVIGAPMYNFGVPSQLKAWIDRILVAGKTFSYSAAGAVGLAGGKRVIVAVSRGAIFAADTPLASAEHVETYLRTVFAFIGVTELEFVVAEGLAIGPEIREPAVAAALGTAAALRAA
jgi:FMN-dependent NADH-azoreductase